MNAPPYRVFWAAGLLSNTGSAAMFTATSWILGDVRLPVMMQSIQQFGMAAGMVTGAILGAWLVGKIKAPLTLLLTTLGEAAISLTIGVLALTLGSDISTTAGVTIAALSSLGWVFIGVGAPAWVTLVADWPGTTDSTKQLLWDSIQFQVGRSIGPLLPGLVGMAQDATETLTWMAFLNTVTFLGVATVISDAQFRQQAGASAPAPFGGLRSVRDLSTGLLLVVALFSFSSDSARIYTARLLQMQGLDSTTFGLLNTVLAITGVLAATIAIRANLARVQVSRVGLLLTCLGIGLWATMGPVATWLAGAALVGAGATLAVNGCTAIALEAAPHRKANVASLLLILRTTSGTAGTVALVPVIGAHPGTSLYILAVLGLGTFLLSFGRWSKTGQSQTPPTS